MKIDIVDRADFLAVLHMLYQRRTIVDRIRARRYRGHWVNSARLVLLEAGKL